jgi:hypothetical protein
MGICQGEKCYDPGATYKDRTERYMIEKLLETLKNEEINFKLRNLAEKVIFIGLEEKLTINEKVKEIDSYFYNNRNEDKESLAISIHSDYVKSSSGVMAYFDQNRHILSESLANKIVDGVCGSTGLKKKRVISDKYSNPGSIGILRENTCLPCLIEAGSIGKDWEKFQNKDFLSKWCDGFINGISQYIEQKNQEKKSQIEKKIELNSSLWIELENCKRTIEAVQEQLHFNKKTIKSLL